MPTATTGFAIGMDCHENTRPTFGAEILLSCQLTVFNAILGPLC